VARKLTGSEDRLPVPYGIRSGRQWRKLHLGIDAVTHETVASGLTPDNVGDVSEMLALLDQIDMDAGSLTAHMMRPSTILSPSVIPEQQ
jgi:hypothetical protein